MQHIENNEVTGSALEFHRKFVAWTPPLVLGIVNGRGTHSIRLFQPWRCSGLGLVPSPGFFCRSVAPVIHFAIGYNELMLRAVQKQARVCAVAAQVIRNTRLCDEHLEIELVYLGFPNSEPGQFLELHCAEVMPESARVVAWPGEGRLQLSGLCFPRREAFLNRPFSIADHWMDADGVPHFTVISRTIGPGTAFLERLRPGDTLSVTGPLGVGFQIPRHDVPLLLVGGGVGIPPLLYLARRLHERKHRGVSMGFGVRKREYFPLRLIAEPDRGGSARICCELPGGADYPSAVATDDGSLGVHGLVTTIVERWAEQYAAKLSEAQVLACGPQRMLQALAAQTRRLGVGAQLCIERNMGCGLGTCLSCVVRVREPTAQQGWRWALSCSEGPVFDRDRLIDYNS